MFEELLGGGTADELQIIIEQLKKNTADNPGYVICKIYRCPLSFYDAKSETKTHLQMILCSFFYGFMAK